MKKVLLNIILLLALSLQIHAQYGGGNGRGEIYTAISTLQLNGKGLTIYGGGNGRGEMLVAVNTNQLNGKMLSIYGGGNGRGEILNAITTNQLNGKTLSIYGGGNGRGENLTAITTNQLNGQTLSIYGGGNGRGEIANDINSNSLNGAMLLMFHGGNGRGEYNSVINTLQLDGVVASLYMGGNGRGETTILLTNQGLPAQVSCFGAVQDGKQIRVYWQTLSEKDCDFFTVEKSVDGTNFQPIGTVNSACNSSAVINYQFFDVNPVEGANYYRLKTTGKDGKCYYSAVVVVYFHSAPSCQISVFPNPAKSQFTLSINGIDTKILQHIDLKMLSANGQTVLVKQDLVGSTQNIDVSNLTAGTYFLIVNINGKESKVQVIKE